MKKIVTVLKPFTLKQNVYVYEDNDVIEVLQANDMADLENLVVAKAEEYDITDVTLVGAKKFSAGVKQKIEENELTKYNSKRLNIEVRAN